jgi:hypothetical protein
VEYLLRLGARISERNQAALATAAEWGLVPMVELLLKQGARPTSARGKVLLAAARSNNNNVEVVRVLIEAGASIDAALKMPGVFAASWNHGRDICAGLVICDSVMWRPITKRQGVVITKWLSAASAYPDKIRPAEDGSANERLIQMHRDLIRIGRVFSVTHVPNPEWTALMM